MRQVTLAVPSLIDSTPLEMLDAAAEAGFDGVGLRLNPSSGPAAAAFHPVAGNASLIAEIKSRMANTGLFVLEINSFYLLPEINFDTYEAALALGGELGAKYAIVIGNDPDWQRSRDNFARICDLAAPYGLNAAVEVAPHTRMATLEQTLRLLGDADRLNAAAALDPVYFFQSGGTIADLREVDPARLPYSQLCDGVLGPEEYLPTLGRATPTIERRLPGDGALPLLEWLDTMPSDVPLSMKCLPRPAGLSHHDWAKAIKDKTDQLLTHYYEARHG